MSDEAKWEEWREKARRNRKIRNKPEMSVAELSPGENATDNESENMLREGTSTPDKTEMVSMIEEVEKGKIRKFRAEEEIKALRL